MNRYEIKHERVREAVIAATKKTMSGQRRWRDDGRLKYLEGVLERQILIGLKEFPIDIV
jgi:hypothetical protein